jgi:hypothetical protein
MKNDILIGRVGFVFVTAPGGRFEVDLDISADRLVSIKLDYGIAKIRAGLVIPKSRMEDAHWPAILKDQPLAQQPLVLPDRLKEAFGRRGGRFPEIREGPAGNSPLRVNI